MLTNSTKVLGKQPLKRLWISNTCRNKDKVWFQIFDLQCLVFTAVILVRYKCENFIWQMRKLVWKITYFRLFFLIIFFIIQKRHLQCKYVHYTTIYLPLTLKRKLIFVFLHESLYIEMCTVTLSHKFGMINSLISFFSSNGQNLTIWKIRTVFL